MSPSLRFIGLALIGWAGMRGAMLGVLPSIGSAPADARPPSIVPTVFPPLDPVTPPPPAEAYALIDANGVPIAAAAPANPSAYAYPPAYYGAPAATPAVSAVQPVQPAFYAPIPVLDEWPLSRLASASYSPLASRPMSVAGQSIPQALQQQKIDRLQLTAWALMRTDRTAAAAPGSLVSGGTLGGNQAGARLAYNVTPQIAATLRTTTPIGGRGGELALGARLQPMRSLPVWITAERRMAMGRFGGGRNAFALFLEGGVYDRPMPLGLKLDAYAQAGVVGFRNRDRFVDGAMTLTRPVWRNMSAGVGVWGGAQPGVYRVDAGPRVTMKVRDNIKLHVDYRQRIAGEALPGSGPAITLAGDF